MEGDRPTPVCEVPGGTRTSVLCVPAGGGTEVTEGGTALWPEGNGVGRLYVAEAPQKGVG